MKLAELWHSVVVVEYISGASGQGHLISFGTPVARWPITGKHPSVERNGLQFGTQGHE